MQDFDMSLYRHETGVWKLIFILMNRFYIDAVYYNDIQYVNMLVVSVSIYSVCHRV